MAYSTLSPLPTDSNLVDNTNIEASEHNIHRQTREDRINVLLVEAKAQEVNRASGTEPTDKLEGQIWCRTTSDPAELLFYKDGAANLFTLASLEAANAFTGANTFAAGTTLTDPALTLNGVTWPSFHAHRNAVNQLNITGIDQIEFNNDSAVEGFDTNADYDAVTNFRFTPTVAGKYSLIIQIEWTAITVGDQLILNLRKNGTDIGEVRDLVDDSIQTQQLQIIVNANGTTDQFEVFAQNINRNTSDIIGLTARTFFCGSRIA